MPQTWMNPLNKIIWRNAFKRSLTEVQLSDGRMFSINYDRRPGKAWIAPIGSDTVPCGWVDLEKARKDDWLG